MTTHEYDGTREYALKALKYAIYKPDNEVEFDLEV